MSLGLISLDSLDSLDRVEELLFLRRKLDLIAPSIAVGDTERCEL
jgi:hypothetical protein